LVHTAHTAAPAQALAARGRRGKAESWNARDAAELERRFTDKSQTRPRSRVAGVLSGNAAILRALMLRCPLAVLPLSDVMNAVLPSLLSTQQPAQRSGLSAFAWALEAPLARLLQHGPPPQPRRLNLGCGDLRPAGWLNADFATARWLLQGRRWPQWSFDASRRWPCPDEYFDVIHSEHVLEHFIYADGIRLLSECLRTLRRGGILRLSVPDLAKFVDAYVSLRDGSATASEFLALGPGVAAFSKLAQCHGHLSVWDGPTLQQALLELGFARAAVTAYRVSAIPDVMDRADRAWQSCYVEAVK
jgi:SAM-dependent methyltransferase